MMHRMLRLMNISLVLTLSGSLALFAEPLPQNTQQSAQTSSSQVSDVPTDSQRADQSSPTGNTAAPPVAKELPDAPTPAQPVQQNQGDSQQQNPNAVPSGAAGAKAPTVKGAPASRLVGAAIAPAKQRQRRSLLIKAGLVAGACVAVGSVFALSKGSPSKPPGAP